MTYELASLDEALKEWRKLDNATREQFKAKLPERLQKLTAIKRGYHQTAWVASTESLRQQIDVAFNGLLLARWIDEITLNDFAASAGTTR
jgi:hypothetical protein